MKAKNPKIEQREFEPNQPGKRLYFYPKYRTVAPSEKEAKRKLAEKNPIDRKVDKEIQKPKKQTKKFVNN